MKALLLLCLLSLGLQSVQETEAQGCSTLIVTTARGIQCLHCTHPKAEKQALALLEPLLNSCHKNIALGFVLDSSFGNNFDIISKMTRTLSENNRHVFLHFYFLNGPAQRRYADNVFPDSIFQINPFEFREKIKTSQGFQNQYLKFVRSFSDLFLNLQALDATISFSPMLEDNFDNATFNKMIDLTKAALPVSIDPAFVRSTCRDCFPGNESEIPAGIAREEHRGDLSFNFSNGVISNDGWGYIKFPGDHVKPISKPVSHQDKRIEKIMSLSELRKPLLKASARNDIFLLWLSKYQQTLPGNKSVNINKRNFPMPRKNELRLIRDF